MATADEVNAVMAKLDAGYEEVRPWADLLGYQEEIDWVVLHGLELDFLRDKIAAEGDPMCGQLDHYRELTSR